MKKAENKDEIKYKVHNLSCACCNNEMNSHCFYLPRHHLRYWIPGKTNICTKGAYKMVESVAINLDLDKAIVGDSKELSKLNSKFSCPFHSGLRKDCVETDVECYILK